VAAFWANQQTPAPTSISRAPGITAQRQEPRERRSSCSSTSPPRGAAVVRRLQLRVPGEPAGVGESGHRRWGKFKQDDINVAAAGEFQAAATKLADRAGYK
jgi:iron(III) transport system substrate-binding protein